jgi:hypothetical protein
VIVDDPLCVSTILTRDVYLDMIFIPNESKRYSLGYCAFIKSYFSFDKYSNNNQVLDLTYLSIKLIDTRVENENQFLNTKISSKSS